MAAPNPKLLLQPDQAAGRSEVGRSVQGKSNAGHHEEYEILLKALVRSWWETLGKRLLFVVV
jgi:hypothetical protein